LIVLVLASTNWGSIRTLIELLCDRC